MTRDGRVIEDIERELERRHEQERRASMEAARAAALAFAHAREDRELQRTRAQLVYDARPERREAVATTVDLAILKRQLDRKCAPRPSPAGDVDAGRGVRDEPAPAWLVTHWTDALRIVG